MQYVARDAMPAAGRSLQQLGAHQNAQLRISEASTIPHLQELCLASKYCDPHISKPSRHSGSVGENENKTSQHAHFWR
eukprot:4960875-Amphidinium_carterae.1